jgi:exopolysaccharide biosynthesis polyprenyl glycosylphosphotransferase
MATPGTQSDLSGRDLTVGTSDDALQLGLTLVEPTLHRSAALRRFLRRDAVRVSDGVALILAAGVNGARPWLAVALAATAFAMLAAAGTQRARLSLSSVAESRKLFVCVFGAGVLWAPLALFVNNMQGLFWQPVLSVVVVVVLRSVTYAGLRTARRRGLRDPALIIGKGPAVEQVVEMLEDHPELGLEVTGVHADLPVDEWVRLRPGVTHVVVSSATADADEVVARMRMSVLLGARVYVVPRLGAALPIALANHVEMAQAIPFVRLPAHPLHRPSWRFKRCFDIVCATLAIALLSPLLLAIAIGIKLTSPGPILFRQARLGRGGVSFTMFKFRTYPVDHVDDKWSRDHDECPLVFGRFLRRTSLDELPQLFNAVRGDMSIVGPRPERLQFARQLTAEVPGYVDRHRVPGGITGAAQVEGLWGPCNVTERVRFDNRYIDDWSLWGDFVILLRTMGAVLRKAVS